VACGVLVLSIGFPSLLAQGAGWPDFGGQAGQRPENVPVALEGYCAVCQMRGHRWVKGKPEHSAIYDGRRYFFPSENEKREFVKAPSQYAPVLNGDSVVAYASSGQRVAGNIRFATLKEGRLYLFQSEAEKQRFSANPAKYALASTAATTVAGSGASCPCGSKNCKACQAKGGAPVGSVPVQRVRQIAIRGTTVCATCKYGVPPLGAPKTLGLAVETNDGKVYIVEDADRLYPNIYEGRFQKLPVELRGQVLQTNGKFVWVKSASVKVVR